MEGCAYVGRVVDVIFDGAPELIKRKTVRRIQIIGTRKADPRIGLIVSMRPGYAPPRREVRSGRAGNSYYGSITLRISSRSANGSLNIVGLLRRTAVARGVLLTVAGRSGIRHRSMGRR